MMSHVLVMPDGEAIPYQLERRSRRTIGMKISASGLVVHAPRRVSQSLLESALRTKADWIRKKLAQIDTLTAPSMLWEDNVILHLLGQPITLNISHDSRNRQPVFTDGQLNLRLTTVTDSALIQKKVLDWYRKQALADFSRRLEIFATQLGVPKPRLFLSNAQSRWGSCNSKQEIRINWRLIQATPHIINYVICHELAHLKEMNHSAKFWAVVESLYPEYKAAEKELRTLSPSLHRL